MPQLSEEVKLIDEVKQRKERKKRAQDWKLFRRDSLLTQKRMAEILGVCRRTIQLVEGGHITPKVETLRRFEVFRRKYDLNSELNLKPFLNKE